MEPTDVLSQWASNAMEGAAALASGAIEGVQQTARELQATPERTMKHLDAIGRGAKKMLEFGDVGDTPTKLTSGTPNSSASEFFTPNSSSGEKRAGSSAAAAAEEGAATSPGSERGLYDDGVDRFFSPEPKCVLPPRTDQPAEAPTPWRRRLAGLTLVAMCVALAMTTPGGKRRVISMVPRLR